MHTRDADDDTAAILAEEQANGPFTGLIHCFSSGRDLAEKMLDLGFYISISGIVTFNKAEALRETVRGLPLDRILVETDAPYLAPVPYRGKRNEPAYVAGTAARVAALKGLTPEELARAHHRQLLPPVRQGHAARRRGGLMRGLAAASCVLRGSRSLSSGRPSAGPVGSHLSMKKILNCSTLLHPEVPRAARPRRVGRKSPSGDGQY